ncbi:hypothetical protein [Saccharothrix australiensis]|uniref:Uncharacterized protein n=1 Tax=Saccharothrix australiensis TaxID=2072 RepID=A0A495VWR6_9PSEU|nr:hypothetical protein [Saccharothrix australiensis]RKT53023.1 hypothetical protein C8E97_1567 [Saccharothrix australiensis]
MTAVLLDDSEEAQETDASPSFPEGEFGALIWAMVNDNAPRVFAVVQEYGEREDARVGAWGLAFPERAEVVSVEGTFRMGAQSPEGALRMFESPGVRARVVWVDKTGAVDRESAG